MSENIIQQVRQTLRDCKDSKSLQSSDRFFKPGEQAYALYIIIMSNIAASEASWFTAERPAEIYDFWMTHYPEIDTIPNKLAQMQRACYMPVATFVLPENCWTEHFLLPKELINNRNYYGRIWVLSSNKKGLTNFVMLEFSPFFIRYGYYQFLNLHEVTTILDASSPF